MNNVISLNTLLFSVISGNEPIDFWIYTKFDTSFKKFLEHLNLKKICD